MRPRRLLVGCVASAIVLLLFTRPLVAGISSLWTDDATLVQQLVELMKIREEMSAVSDGVLVTARATENLVEMYQDVTAAIDEVQRYGPEALWRDFRSDLYAHYPGFRYLEGNEDLADKWKKTRSKSPITAYEAIGAVFGDLSAPLRERERRGEIKTTTLRLQRFEAAGALSLSADAEQATKQFDDDARRLYEQAERVRSGGEAEVLSARALAMVAAQNSHILRLLARRLRFDGFDAALQYKAAVERRNGLERDIDGVIAFERAAFARPKMMEFPALSASGE